MIEIVLPAYVLKDKITGEYQHNLDTVLTFPAKDSADRLAAMSPRKRWTVQKVKIVEVQE